MNIAIWNLQDWTNVAQIIGIAIAAAALVVTAVQARHTARTSRAQFWLELRRMFADHHEVHLNLRPDGKWAAVGAGPSSTTEWAAVEAYMGLFEHCERMLVSGLIDLDTFNAIYGYRLRNLLGNSKIVDAKLRNPVVAAGWQDFIALLTRLELRY